MVGVLQIHFYQHNIHTEVSLCIQEYMQNQSYTYAHSHIISLAWFMLQCESRQTVHICDSPGYSSLCVLDATKTQRCQLPLQDDSYGNFDEIQLIFPQIMENVVENLFTLCEDVSMFFQTCLSHLIGLIKTLMASSQAGGDKWYFWAGTGSEKRGRFLPTRHGGSQTYRMEEK